eukprot:gnl/MRDRNA2_/MRDRNA2_72403_c0_seq1.p1 gnl/MRDRNA2_/MRDRNA2_72403_c0~~gnl/MRDRNA2_/MRDRNA2_72403_c0_seq1.p1  ORF type:complete len:1348 (+),score=297.61 gnl/MRDRNA2_/MRDRNA2_72403_c0_seq1:73-4116(+)
MGVHGLWELVSPAGQRVALSALENKVIAVDASIWLFHFLKAMRDEDGNMTKGAHLIGFFRRICKLLFLKIRPVFVFDGPPPRLKLATLRARREQRENDESSRRKLMERLLRNRLKMHVLSSATASQSEQDCAGINETALHLESVNQEMDQEKGENIPSGSHSDKLEACVVSDEDSGSEGEESQEELEMQTALEHSSRPRKKRRFVPEMFQNFLASRRGVDELNLPELPSQPLRQVLNVPRRSRNMREPDEWKGFKLASGEVVTVPLDGPIDPSVFESLAPRSKYDLLSRVQETWLGESRMKAVQSKDDMKIFANVQIESFLRHIRTNHQISEAKRDMAAEVTRSVGNGLAEGEEYTPPSFLAAVGGGTAEVGPKGSASCRGGTAEVAVGGIKGSASETRISASDTTIGAEGTFTCGKRGRKKKGGLRQLEGKDVLPLAPLEGSVEPSLVSITGGCDEDEPADDSAGSHTNAPQVASTSSLPCVSEECEEDIESARDLFGADFFESGSEPETELFCAPNAGTSFCPEASSTELNSTITQFPTCSAKLDPGSIAAKPDSTKNNKPEDTSNSSEANTYHTSEITASAKPHVSCPEVVLENIIEPAAKPRSESSIKPAEELRCEISKPGEEPKFTITASQGLDSLEDEEMHHRSSDTCLGGGFIVCKSDPESEPAVTEPEGSCLDAVEVEPQEHADVAPSSKINSADLQENAVPCPTVFCSDSEEPRVTAAPSPTVFFGEELEAEEQSKPSAEEMQRRTDELERYQKELQAKEMATCSSGSRSPPPERVLKPIKYKSEQDLERMDKDSDDELAQIHENQATKHDDLASQSTHAEQAVGIQANDLGDAITSATLQTAKPSQHDERQNSTKNPVPTGSTKTQKQVSAGSPVAPFAWCGMHFQYCWRCAQEGLSCQKKSPVDKNLDAVRPSGASTPSSGTARALLSEEGVEAEDAEDLDAERLQSHLEQEQRELVDELHRAKRGTDRPTEEMEQEIISLLEAFGIPYVKSPCEAEAQCAYLCEVGLVDAVASDDSDTLVFGAKEVYRRLFVDDIAIEKYTDTRLKSRLGLGKGDLEALAMLLGCDYTMGVRGIGIVNALEVALAFRPRSEENNPTVELYLEALRNLRTWAQDIGTWEDSEGGTLAMDSQDLAAFKKSHRRFRQNWSFPEDFPNHEVLEAFRRPVADRSSEPFHWAPVDVQSVCSLLQRVAAMPDERIRERLLPALKKYESVEIQPRITDYLTPPPGGEQVATVRSVRMQKALSGLRGEPVVASAESGSAAAQPQEAGTNSNASSMPAEACQGQDTQNTPPATQGQRGRRASTKPQGRPAKRRRKDDGSSAQSDATASQFNRVLE